MAMKLLLYIAILTAPLYAAFPRSWATPTPVTIPVPVVASGGSNYDLNGCRIHVFTTSEMFNVTSGGAVDVLVVAGGGGGSSGGGGAGGYVYTNMMVTTTSFVTIGLGGLGRERPGANGDQGTNSVFYGLIAYGGGGGGAVLSNGLAGASGGGGGSAITLTFGGTSQFNQGNSGGNSGAAKVGQYPAGGGGGAGSIGRTGTFVTTSIGGYGGSGIVNNISGVPVWYCGGGAGGVNEGGVPGIAIHGGGNGSTLNGANGVANTGGGGGGAGFTSPRQGTGGFGGSGIVILRYPLASTNICPVKIPAIAQYRTWEWENSSLLYTNLIAWYPFTGTGSTYVGANAGSNAVDYSVSNSPATVFVGTSSGATWVAKSGPTSSYYSFDGGDWMAHNFTIASNSAFTICYWKYNNNGYPELTISISGNGIYSQSSLGVYKQNIFGGNWSGFSSFSFGSLLSTGSWQFISVSHNGIGVGNRTNFNAYVNGSFAPKTGDISPGWFLTVANKGLLGSTILSGTHYPMTGFVDDVRIYNTELTALQVTNIFNATKAAHPNPQWP